MLTEGVRLNETSEATEEVQIASIERCLQTLKKQTTVKPRENPNRQEESGATTDPTPIGCQSTPRYQAMDMGMMGQSLPPGMKDGDHPGLGAEILRIGRDQAKRIGRRLEKDVVDDSLVLQGDDGDRFRHREDDVEIRHRQQVGEPLQACQPLTFWAVPVAA